MFRFLPVDSQEVVELHIVMAYLSRIVDQEIVACLSAAGAVVLEGPKACGKTASARQHAASEVLLDVDANARAAVSVAPDLVLGGPTPRLLDEWQVEPALWNLVRRAIDVRRAPGQFILTGSAVPPDDVTRHTGAGRILRVRMRPMSLLESGRSSGAVSLARLMHGEMVATPDPGLTVAELATVIAVGGWPAIRRLPVEAALRAMRAYVDEIRRADIHRVTGTRHDPQRVGRLLAALARHVSTCATLTRLGADAGGGDGPLNGETVRAYLDALQQLMVVEDQPAWRPHLRSRSRLRTSPTRHFVDPALAVAAARATPARLLADLEWLGLLFESLVVRDLRIHAQALDAEVRHYRDESGLEVDAIVERADGAWAAFQVKLGQRWVDEAAASLLTFAERVDTARCGAPRMLGVIVASGMGYRRADGVAVIPVGALGG
jgi:predicted AAA+ superfamily ATPase